MKTLFVLPNAIGDVISGLGAARRLRDEGEVVWVVNRLARPIPEAEGFPTLVPPSPRIRRMQELGAPTETMRAVAEEFLAQVRDRGPFDRVVNPHLTRASCLIAGAAGAKTHRGPLLAVDDVRSDPWGDFFMGGITAGVAPAGEAWINFSILSGLHEPAAPCFESLRHEPGDGALLFQPVAGWPSKMLLPQQAARVRDKLAKLGDVVLLGGPGDIGYFDEMKRFSPEMPPYSSISVAEDLRRIAAARLVVTADTWALHAAAALGTPFLGLMGSTRVFPPGEGWILAPEGEGSWLRDGETSIATLPPDLIASITSAILDGRTPEPPPGDSPVILWETSSLFAHPHRPSSGTGKNHERRILAWARAKSFNDLLRRHRPGAPILPLRPSEGLFAIHADLPAIQKSILAEWPNWSGKFQLFATTFPGLDASTLLNEWIEGARRAIEAIGGVRTSGKMNRKSAPRDPGVGMKKKIRPDTLGFFVAPPHGGPVPIGVSLIRTFYRMKIPTAVYDPGAAFRRETGGDWARYEETIPLRREEVLAAILNLKPAWILTLYREPLDAEAIRVIRSKLPRTRIACWFVEDSAAEVGLWWKEYAPLMDFFFTMQGDDFAGKVSSLGVKAAWLPGASEPEIHFAPTTDDREGVGFVGSCRPGRIRIMEQLIAAGIPLMLGGPGWADHPLMKPHVVINGWVTGEEEAEIYRRSLVVVNLHDGNPGPAFVNPRTFAAAACGALVVSDHRDDLPRLFDAGLIETVEHDRIAERTMELLKNPSAVIARGARASKEVLARHTYEDRIRKLLGRVTGKN